MAEWAEELQGMAARIQRMRGAFLEALLVCGCVDVWAYVVGGCMRCWYVGVVDVFGLMLSGDASVDWPAVIHPCCVFFLCVHAYTPISNTLTYHTRPTPIPPN